MSVITSQALPTTGIWGIDSLHSTVGFSVGHHAVATFRSTFTNVSGAYEADANRLAGQVGVADITLTGLDRLKRHILTKDFFDAEEFPTFSFESTEISSDGDALKVEGEITLRGVTKPITAHGSFKGPRTVRHGDGHITERLGINLTTTTDRRDFGINFNSEVAEGVANLGWDVKIEAALEFALVTEG
jgi:polyisoprenoid-binding protein YceI